MIRTYLWMFPISSRCHLLPRRLFCFISIVAFTTAICSAFTHIATKSLTTTTTLFRPTTCTLSTITNAQQQRHQRCIPLQSYDNKQGFRYKQLSVNRRHRSNPTQLSEQVIGDNNQNDAKEKVLSLKLDSAFLNQSYRLLQYNFLIISIILFLVPYCITTTSTAAALATITTTKSLFATKWGSAMGFGIASKLCSILRTANMEQRLQSDTYKRINIGLFGFTFLSLLALPGELGFIFPNQSTRLLLSRTSTAYLTLVRLVSCLVTYIGWSNNISKESTPMIELWSGIKTTIKGLKVQSAKKALAYRNCLLLVCFGMVSSCMEGFFYIRYQKDFVPYYTLFDITIQLSKVARLFMISTLIYSLKDAAERNRSAGTTFIELNLLVGCWAGIVGFGQAFFYPYGFAPYRGVEMFAFAIPFFIKAYKSHKEKKSLASKVK